MQLSGYKQQKRKTKLNQNNYSSYKVTAKSSKVSTVEFKKFEKICIKVTKLEYDIKYFESCQEIELIPEFFKYILIFSHLNLSITTLL